MQAARADANDIHRCGADHRGSVAGFARGQLLQFQEMGFGVAAALILDATLIRLVILRAA